MILYNKDNNIIETYAVDFIYNKLVKFRKEEMQKIPIDQRFYFARTNYEAILENLPEFIKWKDIAWQNVHYGGLSYHSMYKYYHSEEEQKRQDSLLENYYDSYYNSNPTVKVAIDEESKYYYDIDEDYKYLILTQTKYEPQFPNGAYTLSDILSVTKPLYLLQLFETEQFKKLKDEDISFLSKLLYLTKKPIERIPIEHLDDLKDLSIYNGYDEIMSKVNETQKILQKIKETKTREI